MNGGFKLSKVLAVAIAVAAGVALVPTNALADGTTIAARSSPYGKVIFGKDLRAVYTFTREKHKNSPRCYGSCADSWPPVLTHGKPRAGTGAERTLLGTVKRRSGTRQVTYRERPLYYFVGDTAPKVITCQNVYEFGGTWRIVKPSGKAVR